MALNTFENEVNRLGLLKEQPWVLNWVGTLVVVGSGVVGFLSFVWKKKIFIHLNFSKKMIKLETNYLLCKQNQIDHQYHHNMNN